MKKVIATAAAPAAIGPYSQGVDGGSVVITSGQLPIDASTGAFAEGGIAGQTRQSLENVRAVLAQAGLGMENTRPFLWNTHRAYRLMRLISL